MLRPSAGGLYVVSTGRAAQLEVQRHLYGVSDEASIQNRFVAALDRIANAKAIILGVPSDVGAGYRRGANLGPQAIRSALIAADPDLRGWLDRRGIVDIGDVPVSPLSIEARVLDCVLAINPRVIPIVLGGDHSVAWPVAEMLAKHRRDRWGIVQPDAHTDLLAERLGIKYCYATWSYHANELLGRDGRLVQVGVRASRFPREHWESTLGVRQFWADECVKDPAAALDAIVAHVKRTGVRSVYFSNDIDGTDERFVDATGTPERGGLDPDFVVALIERLGREVGLCAGDVMEVAPPVARTPDGAARTLDVAVRYARATLDSLLS
jgi:agmatinase